MQEATTQPQIIHEVTFRDGWAGLVEGFRKAFAEMGMPMRIADEIGLFVDGHVSKMLGPRPQKGIGHQSFGQLLQVIGAKILIVPDEDARAFVRDHQSYQPRNPMDRAPGYATVQIVLTRNHLRKIGRLGAKRTNTLRGRRRWARMGGKAKAAKMTPKERSKMARKMNAARWGAMRAARASRLSSS